MDDLEYDMIVSYANYLGWPITARSFNISMAMIETVEYLFARSFVKYVFFHLTGTRYVESIPIDRETMVRLFDDTFVQAIHNLSRQYGSEYHKCYLETLGTPHHQLWKHILTVRNHFIFRDYNPEKFLHFCMYVSSMAVHFHRHGVTDAPELAIHNIACRLILIRMSQERWHNLRRTAEFYATFRTGDDVEGVTESPGSEDAIVPERVGTEDIPEHGKYAECKIVYRFSRILRGDKIKNTEYDIPKNCTIKNVDTSDRIHRKRYKLEPCPIHNGDNRAGVLSPSPHHHYHHIYIEQ